MLITVEDSENRARVKLQRAVDEVKKLLVPMVSVALLSDYRKSKEVSKYTTCIAPKSQKNQAAWTKIFSARWAAERE